MDEMTDRLNALDQYVVLEGGEDIEDYLMELIIRRQSAHLKWAASGFRGKFRAEGGLNEEDKRKWDLLEASLMCDQRALKKAKREQAGKGDKSGKMFGSGNPEYCGFFLKGNCQIANCRRPHLEKKDIPCEFLQMGMCKKGDKCDWKH